MITTKYEYVYFRSKWVREIYATDGKSDNSSEIARSYILLSNEGPVKGREILRAVNLREECTSRKSCYNDEA